MHANIIDIRKFYAPFNSGNTDIYDEILADDWINYPNDPGHSADAAGFRNGILDFRDSFKNFKLTIIQIIQDDRNIAIHLQINGIQVKQFAGIPPRFESVTFYGLDRHLLTEDLSKIQNTWHFEDFSSLL